MKKKLALLLSAVMVVGMIPMTAFAKSDNNVTKTITGKVDQTTTTITSGDEPVLEIKNKNSSAENGADFDLLLEGAEWSKTGLAYDLVEGDIEVAGSALSSSNVTLTFVSANRVNVKIDSSVSIAADALITLPILAKLTDAGDASVTVIQNNSFLSNGTYKFATVSSGSTTVTVDKKKDITTKGSELGSVVITETVTGVIKASGKIKLELTDGFEFVGATVDATLLPSNDTISFTVDSDGTSAEGVYVGGYTEAQRIIISGAKVKFDDDEVDAGTVCEMTVSGAGISKTTVEVGTSKDYGMSFTAENKTLPVFYSGRMDDTETLKVTIKEEIANSWLIDRATEITFPEGVKVTSVSVKTDDKGTLQSTQYSIKHKDDYSVVTLNTQKPSGKSKVELVFELSIAGDFTGDIVAVLGGKGIGEEMEVVVGTAVAPFIVETEVNEVAIDYRNVAISDIIIKEADAGVWSKKDGENKLVLSLDNMAFDGTPEVEVIEGDLKIESIKVNGGNLELKAKSSSNKTAGVVKVSNVQLYLNRSLPAGSYELTLSGKAFIRNDVNDPKDTEKFDCDEVTILENFVEVVTAGRDKDDSTFTTKITVTIGADKMMAGTKEIALDVPAYISEGYTMLPVRAVTEALSTAAIVRWDDATKTVTITFGARVVSMTVGSKTMNINGVAVQMSKACEITDSRAFIPLRDLGYALGLNDSAINWDDATKTATLN